MGNIHTSGEDYLETILVLWNKQNGEVRSIDVARELNVTKPSVSNAMKILREGKFITMDENGFITLTDACKIEHVLSDESFAALKKHISEEQ